MPITYHDEKLDVQVLKHFGLNDDAEKELDLSDWADISQKFEKPDGEITIALIGKYTGLSDAYKSLTEALDHAGITHNVRVNVKWINARAFEQKDLSNKLSNVDAILVPGGLANVELKVKFWRLNMLGRIKSHILAFVWHANGGFGICSKCFGVKRCFIN